MRTGLILIIKFSKSMIFFGVGVEWLSLSKVHRTDFFLFIKRNAMFYLYINIYRKKKISTNKYTFNIFVLYTS